MQREIRKIMAPRRSPIEIAEKASAIISLRNVLIILLSERIPNTIKARSDSALWMDHKKAEYMPASQKYLLTDGLKKGISSCLGMVFIAFSIKEEMMRQFFQRE